MNGNHYSGLLKSKSPALYSSQCLATQPSAALITPAGPYEYHIKPSAALSAASQDECQTGQIGSFSVLAQTRYHTTSAAHQVDPQTRSSSTVLTVPTLQNHVSSSVSAQSRHQTRPSEVPPVLARFGNHVVLHFPSQVNCHTKPSVAPTPWQVFSKDGQSQSRQAPACLKYSTNEPKSGRETLQFWNLVRLILEALRYTTTEEWQGPL